MGPILETQAPPIYQSVLALLFAFAVFYVPTFCVLTILLKKKRRIKYIAVVSLLVSIVLILIVIAYLYFYASRIIY